MRKTEEQMVDLNKLAQTIGTHFECNMAVHSDPGDVPYLRMIVDTPYCFQACCVSGKYDLWKQTPKGLRLKHTDLSLEETVKILVEEYFDDKAKRVRHLHPDKSMKAIKEILYRGYQRNQGKPN